MATESPFFLTKVECPICKTINEFETIKVGAYTESGRDTDFCPTGRKWRNARYQAYNPLLYFTATCTNCFYTREFTKSFRDWKEDAYFKTYRLKSVKEQHLEVLARSDSVVKVMGQALDGNRYPNETAVLKLLLVIMDETLNDKQVYLDLGRFYLRIAWLFREMDAGENRNQQTAKIHLSDINERFGTLKESLDAVRGRAGDLEEAIARQFNGEQFSAETKSLLFPVKDKFDQELGSFREVLSLLEGKIDALEAVADEQRKITLGVGEGDVPAGYHNYNSFFDFLAELKGKWDGVPENEKEALRLAVTYYKRAFEEGRDIAEGNQQIQASYLIAELSRRIGDYDQAREYFNTTIRTGQEFIYRNKGDQNRTAMARRILELAIEQGRSSLAEARLA